MYSPASRSTMYSVLRRALLPCIAALICGSSFAASAASLAVAPLRLTFANGAVIASIAVENNGREESLVQAETYAWRQTAGEQTLAPTDDIIAVPPVFRLAPGAKQLIRVGLTRAFKENQEQTYRLTVTEVPTAKAPGVVVVAVRHSLPIFVNPLFPVSPNLTAKLDASAGLEIQNSGSQHLRIHRWRLRNGEGAILAEDTGPGYLLAGGSRLLVITKQQGQRNGQGQPAVFEADTDQKTYKIAVGS